MRQQIQKDKDGVCVRVLYLLKNVKGKKCRTSQDRMSHQQQHTSRRKQVLGKGTFFFHLGKESLRSLCLCVVSFEEIGEILDSPSCYQSYFAG